MVAVCDFRCRKYNLMRFAVFSLWWQINFLCKLAYNSFWWKKKSTKSDKITETQVINCLFSAETCPNNNFDGFQPSKLTNLMHNALLFNILMLETIESIWFWCWNLVPWTFNSVEDEKMKNEWMNRTKEKNE